VKPAIDIQRLRLDRGLSLNKAAAEIGVSPNTLAAAEAGDSNLRPSSALKIASFFGFRVTEVWPIAPAAAAREVA
jgi:transcriptional regulator with XRE-family HTH domain